jgi:hypothetical protein
MGLEGGVCGGRQFVLGSVSSTTPMSSEAAKVRDICPLVWADHLHINVNVRVSSSVPTYEGICHTNPSQ